MQLPPLNVLNVEFLESPYLPSGRETIMPSSSRRCRGSWGGKGSGSASRCKPGLWWVLRSRPESALGSSLEFGGDAISFCSQVWFYLICLETGLLTDCFITKKKKKKNLLSSSSSSAALKMRSVQSGSSIRSKRLRVQGCSPESCLKLEYQQRPFSRKVFSRKVMGTSVYHNTRNLTCAKQVTEWYIEYDPILVKIDSNNNNIGICREKNWRNMHQNVNNDYLGMG